MNDDEEIGTQPGELFVGNSKSRGGWCVYRMLDDWSCEFIWGPAGDRAAAEFKLDELQRSASQ